MLHLSNIKHLPKICPECGIIFRKKVKWGYAMWNSRKYCSVICSSKNKVKKEFIEESKKCVICGSIFHKTKYNKYKWESRDKCSYGCPQIKNITGLKFGKLTALSLAQKKPVKWLCLCECGREVSILYSHLSTGHTKSCGCYKNYFKKHGKTNSPEYKIWNQMIQRCTNKNQNSYKDYGKRGISVCEAWTLFENFYNDMGPRPTNKHQIDRENNSGDYTPLNCRWVTRITNARNKRTTVWIEHNGIKLRAVEWAEKLNIPAKRIYSRIYMGMPTEKILSQKIFNNGFK